MKSLFNFLKTILALIIFSGATFAQTPADTAWTAALGGSFDEPYGYDLDGKTCIAVAPDGSIYMASTTASNDGDIGANNYIGEVDVWVVKFNPEGDTLWTRTIGGSNYDALMDIVAMPDNGCVVAGYSNSDDGDLTGNHDSDGSKNDGFLFRLNPDGTKNWHRMYGGSSSLAGGSDYFHKLTVKEDGNLLAVGKSSSIDGDLPMDFTKFMGGWILEADADNGDVLMSNKIAGQNHDEYNANALWGIDEAPEGDGYIVAGTQSYNLTDDIWIAKVNFDGDTIWSQEHEGSDLDTHVRGFALDRDGNILVATWVNGAGGQVSEFLGGSGDAWILKAGSNGSFKGEKSFGGSDNELVYNFVKTPENNFIITGLSRSSDLSAPGNYGESDFWMVELNSDLDTLKTYKLGGSMSDGLNDVAFSPSGNALYLTGKTTSSDVYVNENNGGIDTWTARINLVPVATEEISTNQALKIYPNPCTNYFTIEADTDSKPLITNIFGKKLNVATERHQNKYIVRTDKLNAGVYFVNIGQKAAKIIVK